MDLFSKLVSDGMRRRGHDVEIWAPKSVFFAAGISDFIRKWLGYVDQYVLFPFRVKRLLTSTPPDTLFVFTDQALGPWVHLVKNRPHVIHCHDFLALRSALGEFPENPTAWSGRSLQRYIRNGFSRGRNFISVSMRTKADLSKYLLSTPTRSEVVYNGLHQSFSRIETAHARSAFGKFTGLDLREGYILHVGGNAWYKNRIGVIEIYEAWRSISRKKLPLILIGKPLDAETSNKVSTSTYAVDIHCQSGVGDDQIRSAYTGSVVFLFPSLAEGFGWPIAEAMASGTPVITTGEAPMSEVAGDAGYFIDKRPNKVTDVARWAIEAAQTLEAVVNLSDDERERAIGKGIENAKRFDTDNSLDQIEKIYKSVLSSN